MQTFNLACELRVNILYSNYIQLRHLLSVSVKCWPSVCGSHLKPDVVIGLCDKPCIPLTTAAIIDFERQEGGGGGERNGITTMRTLAGRVVQTEFCNSCHRPCKGMGFVGLTDLRSIKLLFVLVQAIIVRL